MITTDPRGVAFIEQLLKYDCYGGLDLAAVSDLASFVLSWLVKETYYVYPWFFIPAEGLEERCRHDGVPYNMWAKQGLIELTPGEVTDWRHIVGRIQQLAEALSIRQIAFDRWGARDTVAALKETGIETVPFSQSFMGMGAPVRRIETLIIGKKLVHTGHPILRWNIDCTRMERDYADNMRPKKEDRRKSSKRIDGTVAMIMAVAGAMECEPAPGPVEIW